MSSPLFHSVGLQEITTPGAVAGQAQVYAKSDNNMYFLDGAGVEAEVTDTKRGQVVLEDNAAAFVVNSTGDPHCFHSAAGAASHLNGWTFVPGSAGTPTTISTVADGGSSDLLITTSGVHGRSVGDIVSHTDMDVAAHAGVFQIATVPSTTTYTVPGTFGGADVNGVMDAATSGVVDAGSAGGYRLNWVASASAPDNNQLFNFDMRKNAEVISGTKVQRKFATQNDTGHIGGFAFVTVVDGDRLSFQIENATAANNIVLVHLTIMVERVWKT
jgi:hypothetical protein